MSRYPTQPIKVFSSGKLEKIKLGPAMTELNERERALVDYLIETGTDNYTEACRAAGYSAESYDALRVTSSRKRRDPRIQAAVVELGRQMPALGLPMAMATITSIARDTGHKDALRAALALAAMSGISPITKSEAVVQHNHTLDPAASIEAKLALLPPDIADMLRLQLLPEMIDVTPRLPAPDKLSAEEAAALMEDIL
jgi:hypothetical protein